MKKFVSVLLALCLMVTTLACALADTVVPQHNLMPMNSGDEYYDVRFDVDHDIDADNNIHFTVYDLDEYTRSDLEALKPGDKIVAFGEEITVETVEQDGESFVINGGFELPNGATMVLSEESNDVYFCTDYDDILAYSAGESKVLPMADEMKVSIYRMEEDGSYEGAMDTYTMPAGEVKAFLQARSDYSRDDYVSLDGNLVILVEDGRIVELSVDWAPNV